MRMTFNKCHLFQVNIHKATVFFRIRNFDYIFALAFDNVNLAASGPCTTVVQGTNVSPRYKKKDE